MNGLQKEYEIHTLSTKSLQKHIKNCVGDIDGLHFTYLTYDYIQKVKRETLSQTGWWKTEPRYEQAMMVWLN